MRFSFVTLFSNLIEGYFSDSIMCRAVDDGKICIDFYNPRDYTKDKHNRVDSPMVSGGAGMLLSPQPMHDTLKNIKENSPNVHIVFLTPVAKPFKQHDAIRLAKKEHIVFVSGRYEGFDERLVEQHASEVFSIGDFILTGGELASLVVCDAIARNVKEVLGNEASLCGESFGEVLLEAPAFTKPNSFEGSEVVSEFLKGNHSKIADLKSEMSVCKTKYFRPDLYKRYCHEK